MTKRDKDLNRILDGRNDANIDFEMLVSVLMRLGFNLRVRGSHYTFRKPRLDVSITLATHVKTVPAYQVRQVRRVILEFGELEPDE